MPEKKLDLTRPDFFSPEKFRLSPSKIIAKRKCGQYFFYKYVARIKPKKEDVSLLRGRIVHSAIEFWLRSLLGLNKDIEGFSTKRLIAFLLKDYKLEDKDVSESIYEQFEFPHAERSKFTFEEFLKQMETCVDILKEYITVTKIIPFVNMENLPMIESTLTYDLAVDGEILGEINSEVAKTTNRIDLVAKHNGNIKLIDWKIGLQKYASNKHKISPLKTNDALISYAIAFNRTFKNNDIARFPITTTVVHAVVSKTGLRSKSVEADGVQGVEVFDRVITKEEADEYIRECASELEDIKNVRLTKNKNFTCTTMCEFCRVCLKNDTKGYERTKYAKESEKEDSE